MAHKELRTRLTDGVVQALKPQTRTADALSAAIGMEGYDSALVEYSFGTSGDTLSGSVKVQAQLQECATSGGTYTDVAAANIKGTLPLVDDPAEDDAVHLVAYLGKQPFIKVGLDFTGTHTNGFPTSVTVLRGHKTRLNT